MSTNQQKLDAMMYGWADGIRGGAKDSAYALHSDDSIRMAYNNAHDIGARDKATRFKEFSIACGIKPHMFTDSNREVANNHA